MKKNNKKKKQQEHGDKNSLLSSSEISPLLQDGSTKSLQDLLNNRKNFRSERTLIPIHFNDLSYWILKTTSKIPTVATVAKNFIFGKGKQYRVDILHNMTGYLRLFLCFISSH